MVRSLSKEELKKMLEDKEGFELVNVLGEEQFNKEHIPGSVNIPVNDDNFEQKFNETVPDKDRKVVVYCASFDCQASPTAAQKLEEMGYKDVHDYEGGMKDWKESGYPVESNE